MTGAARALFRARIAETLGVAVDHVTLFARGRVALYAILRALDIGPGDEVIVPAFTCVAVPNAILYAGARPIWADIDPRTYCLDAASVERAFTARTRAVLAQNTFGLSADLVAIMAVARQYHATVIDDCAHGLGGQYLGNPNGATAPLSFFSTQWSKPISTGLGGFAVDREGAAAARLRELESSALEPSAVRVAALRILLYGRERASGGRVFRAGRATYRQLGRLGVVPGSSTRDELEGTAMPARFLERLSESQARLGAERLSRLPDEVARRRRIARAYSTWFIENGRGAAVEPPDQEHTFLRYPVRVSDRQHFISAAKQAGIDLGDWFVSPIHPVSDHLERWGYLAGSAPNAERACREIVNLPTDPALGDNDVEQVIGFMAQHLGLIL